MKLLSLQGRNIGLLKGDFKFEFDEALTVITGPIGCGKSTVLTMIKASLTNTFPGNAASWASWGIPPQEACYFTACWRIGNKILHITKCVSGDKKFELLNLPRLRIDHDDGTTEDVFGSKAALEKTHELMTVPANIIDGHLIVDQDSITAPVSATPAKFKETIHTLTRTNELETIRGQVRDLLASVVVPDVQGPLREAQVEFNLLQGECNKLEAEVASLTQEYSNLQVASLLLQLDEMSIAKKNDDKRGQLDTRRISGTSAYAQLRTQLATQSEAVTSMLAQQYATQAEAEAAKKSLYSADMLLAANKKVEVLQGKAQQLAKDLQKCLTDSPVAPTESRCTIEQQEEFTNQFHKEVQSLAFTKKRLDLVKKGQCPECGTSTSLCQHDLDVLQDLANNTQESITAISSTVLAIKQNISAWKAYDTSFTSYTSCVTSTMEKAVEVNQELEELKDTPKMTSEIKQELTKVASTYDMLERSIDSGERSISALKGHMQSQADMLAAIENELNDIPNTKFDSYEHARITTQHQAALAIRDKINRLDGNVEGAKQAALRAKQKVELQEQRAAAVKPTERFRKILELVNTVLMKDGLPRLLSLQYMQKLNDRLQFYLTTINADFSAAIDENLEFTAKKTDGLTHAARRLSGGQKQQASVCYLLAVSDVFASTLGVLALDEPSGAMQEGNSRDLAEAFNYLAKMGQSTGRQFIVITHSASLAAYGCTNIALEGR